MSIRFPDIQRDHSFRAGPNHMVAGTFRQLAKVAYMIDVPNCVRDTLFGLTPFLGLELRSCNSLDEYLQHSHADESACLILDLQARDREEHARQCQLAREVCAPIIFVCRHCDISAAVCAIKSGAIEVLALPVDSTDLLNAVKAALELDKKQRQRSAEYAELQQRYSRLTPREREVLPLIVRGLLNKQAAGVLGISEVTLQIHRSHVMRKMQADSVADLVRMASKLRIPFWREVQGALGMPLQDSRVERQQDSRLIARRAVR